MKITIPKTEFLEAIASLGKIANGKSAKLNSHYVQIKAAHGKQSVCLTASDFDQALAFDLPEARVESDFDVAVSCLQLRNLVKDSGRKGDLTFAVTADSLEVLDNGVSVGLLPLLGEEVDFPNCAIPKDAVMVILPTIFREVLADAASCASKDPNRPMLQNVCISRQGVVSTDGRELYHVPLPLNPLSAELIIPFTPALASIKRRWLSLATWLLDDLRFLAIRGENFTYLAHCEGGKYPNWPSVVPDEHELNVAIQFNEEGARQIMEFTSSIDTRLSEYVSLDYEQNKVTIEDAAKRKITVPVVTDGAHAPDSISMKAEFLERMFTLGHNRMLLAPGEAKPIKVVGGTGFYIFMGCMPGKPKNEPDQQANPVQEANQAEKAIAENGAEKAPQNNGFSTPEASKNTPSVQSPTTTKNTTTNQATKGSMTMQTSIPSTTAITAPQSIIDKSEPEITPIEEANQCLEDIKGDIKNINERFQQAARKLKEALLHQRQKERQYFDAIKKLERIRQASGF